MNTKIYSTSIALGLVIAGLLATAVFGTAASVNWTNTAGGNWGVAANWSPNGVPTVSCGADADCAACGPKNRVCDTASKKCVACLVDATGSQCAKMEFCHKQGTGPKSPAVRSGIRCQSRPPPDPRSPSRARGRGHQRGRPGSQRPGYRREC